MIDFIDPFLTFYQHHPEHGASDACRETEALFLRQGLIMDFIEGHESPEAVLDCLEEQGVGADAYLTTVIANVQYVIDAGVFYVENESGLLLPELRQ